MRSDIWHSSVILVLASSLAVFLFIANRELLQRERTAREGLVAVAYLETSFPDADAAKWIQTVRAELPEALKIDYISKAEALQTAQADPSLAKALVMLKDNPLPSTLTIRFSDEAWLHEADPADALKAHTEVSEIRWNPILRDAFRTAKMWRKHIHQAAWGLGVLLGIWIIGSCRLGKFTLKTPHES